MIEDELARQIDGGAKSAGARRGTEPLGGAGIPDNGERKPSLPGKASTSLYRQKLKHRSGEPRKSGGQGTRQSHLRRQK